MEGDTHISELGKRPHWIGCVLEICLVRVLAAMGYLQQINFINFIIIPPSSSSFVSNCQPIPNSTRLLANSHPVTDSKRKAHQCKQSSNIMSNVKSSSERRIGETCVVIIFDMNRCPAMLTPRYISA